MAEQGKQGEQGEQGKQGVAGATGATGQKGDPGHVAVPKKTLRFLTGAAIIIIAELAVLLAFVIPSLGTNRNQEHRLRAQQHKINAVISALVVGQIENCRQDHRFRIQYRNRGLTEKELLDFFLTLASATVANGQDPTGTSQEFIEKFMPLTQTIHIIPVPNCQQGAARLRRAIEQTGIMVPPIPSLEPLKSGKKSEDEQPSR